MFAILNMGKSILNTIGGTKCIVIPVVRHIDSFKAIDLYLWIPIFIIVAGIFGYKFFRNLPKLISNIIITFRYISLIIGIKKN